MLCTEITPKIIFPMNKIHYLAGLLLIITSCTTNPKTDISIHIKGETNNYSTFLSTTDTIFTINLDSTHTANISLPEHFKANYATIQFGILKVPVYIEPNKDFNLTLNVEGRTISTSFTGEGAIKNKYLNSEPLKKSLPPLELQESDFLKQLREQEIKLSAHLDSMNFDSHFNKLEKKRIHYSLYSALPTYIAYHPFYAKIEQYLPSEKLYEALKQAIVEEPELMNMAEYKNALLSYFEIIGNQGETNALAILKKQLDIIQNNFKTPAIKEFIIDHFICKYIGRYGIDGLSEFASIYKANVTNPQKLIAYKALCDKWAKVAKGQPSIDFKFTDINGKNISLKDLAGKYVYIDCWATWCGPCRGELPYLQELEHRFKNKNIHFVSISCDQNKADWEKMVKEEKLGGIQLHYGNDKSFMEFYMITGIPRFILLDREGKIIQSNATRPSNPETLKNLSALEGI